MSNYMVAIDHGTMSKDARRREEGLCVVVASGGSIENDAHASPHCVLLDANNTHYVLPLDEELLPNKDKCG